MQSYLQSEYYVPERILEEINEATSSMMASGLHQFYTSLATFKNNLVERAYSIVDDDCTEALTMEQLKRPLILLFCLWGVALIVFIGESIVSKWKLRNQKPIRTRRNRPLHVSHTA